MIMYSLAPAQSGFAPETLATEDALAMINAMVADGVCVRSSNFGAPDGRHVITFWSTDQEGRVATVWEHTMRYLPNVPTAVAVRDVETLDYALEDRAMGPRDTDGYSVGE